MNKFILYTAIIILLQGCKIGNEKKEEIKSSNTEDEITKIEKEENDLVNFDVEEHLKKYENLKKRILDYQKNLKTRNDINSKAKIELVENYINEMLVDSIFNYWLGTEWDFNGYTEKPKEGEIACGYFVSTTLRDLGIKLNRFKIAQKAASEIIYALCDHESIIKISSLEKVSEFLENIDENEILIVGLDYHVGFIFKRDNENYFAHSNYINRKGAEIELLQNSAAFKNTNLYVIGNLTKNKKIIKNWLK